MALSASRTDEMAPVSLEIVLNGKRTVWVAGEGAELASANDNVMSGGNRSYESTAGRLETNW